MVPLRLVVACHRDFSFLLFNLSCILRILNQLLLWFEDAALVLKDPLIKLLLLDCLIFLSVRAILLIFITAIILLLLLFLVLLLLLLFFTVFVRVDWRVVALRLHERAIKGILKGTCTPILTPTLRIVLTWPIIIKARRVDTPSTVLPVGPIILLNCWFLVHVLTLVVSPFHFVELPFINSGVA